MGQQTQAATATNHRHATARLRNDLTQPAAQPIGASSDNAHDDDPFAPVHGRIPAFDQFGELANGQTVRRLNRVPRTPAPAAQPGLFRRLVIRTLQLALVIRIDRLHKRAGAIERQLTQTAHDAHQLAQLFRYSPLIEARRRTLRRELAGVAKDFQQVRQRMDNLTAELQ